MIARLKLCKKTPIMLSSTDNTCSLKPVKYEHLYVTDISCKQDITKVLVATNKLFEQDNFKKDDIKDIQFIADECSGYWYVKFKYPTPLPDIIEISESTKRTNNPTLLQEAYELSKKINTAKSAKSMST